MFSMRVSGAIEARVVPAAGHHRDGVAVNVHQRAVIFAVEMMVIAGIRVEIGAAAVDRDLAHVAAGNQQRRLGFGMPKRLHHRRWYLPGYLKNHRHLADLHLNQRHRLSLRSRHHRHHRLRHFHQALK